MNEKGSQDPSLGRLILYWNFKRPTLGPEIDHFMAAFTVDGTASYVNDGKFEGGVKVRKVLEESNRRML